MRLKIEFKRLKNCRFIRINDYDFGFGSVKDGDKRFITVLLGKIGFVFDLPYTNYAIIKKRADKGSGD